MKTIKHFIFFGASCLLPVAAFAAATEEATRVQQIGSEAAGLMLSGVKSELQRAMSSRGPAHALSFCNAELPTIVGRISKELPQGVTVRRATLKPRNPRNAADETDKQAIDFFVKAFESEKPELRAKHYTVQGISGDFRYYQPIMIAAECLACHGERNSLPDDVKRLLDQKYPRDQATGYGIGDLRGVVRVEIRKGALADH